MHHIHLFPHHFPTPTAAYIAILNKQKCLFSTIKGKEVKQVLCGDWYQWDRGGYKEKVKEGNIV
jgi:hypothetical protein